MYFPVILSRRTFFFLVMYSWLCAVLKMPTDTSFALIVRVSYTQVVLRQLCSFGFYFFLGILFQSWVTDELLSSFGEIKSVFIRRPSSHFLCKLLSVYASLFLQVDIAKNRASLLSRIPPAYGHVCLNQLLFFQDSYWYSSVSIFLPIIKGRHSSNQTVW